MSARHGTGTCHTSEFTARLTFSVQHPGTWRAMAVLHPTKKLYGGGVCGGDH